MLRTSSITIKSVKLLLLSLLIFTNICVFAQRNAIEFDRITVEEGLSQGTVYDIHQDHKGFMWFGTEDGLNRYDGYSFK
ncbi:MAG: two-component regulator propeller domain-containing protein, partial [Perlabentimonas sp.]